jgi:hypothetical protein
MKNETTKHTNHTKGKKFKFVEVRMMSRELFDAISARPPVVLGCGLVS